MSAELIQSGERAAVPMMPMDPIMAIIDRITLSPDFDIAKVRQMLELKLQFDATEQRKAFTAAMAEFKKNPPAIVKNKHVHFVNRAGGTTDYDHATHSEVTYKIIASLAEHGFSHRWVTTQPDGQVCVECIITHRLGHAESQKMTAPPDTTGNKSPVQAIVSTKTMLERYTLLGATGLSAADLPDADDRKDEKAHVAPEVWKGLGEAAQEGEATLRKMWEALGGDTQTTILECFTADWSAIKSKAAAVDTERKCSALIKKMIGIMSADKEEADIAKDVFNENARLNREEQELFKAAWRLMSAGDRKCWKDFQAMGKQK